MTTLVNTPNVINRFFSQLVVASQRKFTGRLDIEVHSAQKWSLYWNQGSLVWANGGNLPHRRWHRIMAQCCPQLNWQQVNWRDADQLESWGYHFLTVLVQREILSINQMVTVIRTNVVEILFDICQKIEQEQSLSKFRTHNHQFPAQTLRQSQVSSRVSYFNLVYAPGISPSASAIIPSSQIISISSIVNQTIKLWSNWVKAGLKFCSPNFAPVLKYESFPETEITAVTYQKLVTLVNGKHTLRELAWLTQQNLQPFTCWLLSFVRQKLVRFLPVQDLQNPTQSLPPLKELKPPQSQLTDNRALIACIDDSPLTCLLMKNLLETSGYRFLGIQDEVQALPKLRQYKPDAIFLDLVMPIANGYEICAQIRRISGFQTKPIIILTSHDSILEQIRAKMAGATDFLSKPVDVDQVKRTLQKSLCVG